ncbi:glycoside hydrolase family protein [Chitinophaga sp. YIM B06452]|uniref:glycoside hydrolase family protein n=1 Tax=Chitinophaga sp. YIM B06452 TaxID=3082158 RepID=UPI0031FEFA5C
MERRDFLRTLSAGLLLPAISTAAALRQEGAFADKILPAPVNGGFMMEGYWVWDPSVVKGEDGRYHMFASRWSKELGFGNWVTNSQIVRAVSDTPEGPYTFEEVVLPARGKGFFDGYTTHNPRILQYGKQYLLYYMGTVYDFPVPNNRDDVWADGRGQRAWMNKRAGVAVADSVYGPWKRLDRPVIEPRPGKWDASITSNPSPVALPDGSIYLMYKSSSKNYDPPLLLGAAMSRHSYKGPYERLSDNPVFSFHSKNKMDNDVEDPFVWYAGDHYELIMKDRFGHICGEEGGGIHATSKNGVDWKLSDPVKAYSRIIRWNDGTTTKQANFERPFLLFENGKPTHLFAATGSGPRPYEVDKTWNMVVPLKH